MTPTFTFDTQQDLESYMTKEPKFMHNRFYEAIDEAFFHGWSEAEILSAYIEEDFNTVTITSTREEWIETLKLGLAYFEKAEEYEKCQDVNLLIQDIRTAFSELYNEKDHRPADGNEQTDL